MSDIIIPGTDKHVHYTNISKAKLAKIVNDQSAQLRRLQKQSQLLGNILIAIAADPDVLEVTEGGKAHVDYDAVARVQKDSELTVRRQGDRLYLAAKGPGERSVIQAPTFLVPN